MVKSLFTLCLLFSTLFLDAGNILSIGKSSEIPVIDGKINEKCWEDTLAVTGFTLPGSLKYAQYQSEVRMFHNGNYLYGAICCQSPSGSLNNRQVPLQDNPAIWKNDALELFFVGKGEARQLIIDSNGSYFDAASRKVVVEDSFNTVWRHDKNFAVVEKFAVKTAGDSWSAEFVIPLAALPAGELRFNAIRDMPKAAESSSWALMEAPRWWEFDTAAEMVFVDRVPGMKIEVLPQLTGESRAAVKIAGDAQAELLVQGKKIPGNISNEVTAFTYSVTPETGYKSMRLILRVIAGGKVVYSFEHEKPTGYVKFTPINLSGKTLCLNSSLNLESNIGWETRHNYQGFKVKKNTRLHFLVPEGIVVNKAQITGEINRDRQKYIRYTQDVPWVYNGRFWIKSFFTTTLPSGSRGKIYYSSECPDSIQPEMAIEFEVVDIKEVAPPEKFITGHYDNWVPTLQAAMVWKKTGSNTFPLRGNRQHSIDLARELKKAGFYIRRGDYFWPDGVYQGGARNFSKWAENDRQARARDIAGYYIANGNDFQISPAYRGKFYDEAIAKEIEFCKKAGINWMAFDLENYIQPRGNIGDFSPRTLGLFREYWQKKFPDKAIPDPKQFEKTPEKFPFEHQQWVNFKCALWADFFGEMKRRFAKELSGSEFQSSPFDGVVFSDWNTERPFTLERQNQTLRNAEYFKVFNIMELDAYSSIDRNLREIEWQFSMMEKFFPEIKVQWIITPSPDRLNNGSWGFYITTAPRMKDERKYLFMETMTMGAKGFYTWYTPFITMDYLRQFAEGVALLNKVEKIVLNGTPVKVESDLPAIDVEEYFFGQKSVWKNQKQVFTRGLKYGDQTLISVGEYRNLQEITVEVKFDFESDTTIRDLETEEIIAEVRQGAKSFTVKLPEDRRCRLFLLETKEK